MLEGCRMRIIFPPPPFWETPRHSCLSGSTSSAKNYRVKGSIARNVRSRWLTPEEGLLCCQSLQLFWFVCFLSVCNTFLVQTSQTGKAASTLGHHGCVVTASA